MLTGHHRADSNLAISPFVILPSTVMTITLNVENVGKMAGEEVFLPPLGHRRLFEQRG